MALPLFVALIASNASLNSGFSSRNTVFSLSVMASKAECWYLSSYVKKFVKVVCKSMENLGFLLYYCLTIKVSKLCCTPLLWPSYFSQTIVKSFRVFFFLLSAAILRPLPPTFETSFPFCTAVDFVEYQSVLSCFFTLALFLSSNSAFAFLSVSSNQSWCFRLDLHKTSVY